MLREDWRHTSHSSHKKRTLSIPAWRFFVSRLSHSECSDAHLIESPRRFCPSVGRRVRTTGRVQTAWLRLGSSPRTTPCSRRSRPARCVCVSPPPHLQIPAVHVGSCRPYLVPGLSRINWVFYASAWRLLRILRRLQHVLASVGVQYSKSQRLHGKHVGFLSWNASKCSIYLSVRNKSRTLAPLLRAS